MRYGAPPKIGGFKKKSAFSPGQGVSIKAAKNPKKRALPRKLGLL